MSWNSYSNSCLVPAGGSTRAKYWKSMLIFCIAGLFAGVILMTAAGLAVPLLSIAIVIVFIPWLMWGFAIHTERLHDRDKGAWRLVCFACCPACGATSRIWRHLTVRRASR